jgi:hypothetical protein
MQTNYISDKLMKTGFQLLLFLNVKSAFASVAKSGIFLTAMLNSVIRY